MNAIFKNLFNSTTFLTVFSGVAVYILSQFVLEMFINPYKEFKRLRQKIIYTCNLYCCYYSSPYNLIHEERNVRDKVEYDEARREMRKLGSELSSYIGIVSSIRFNKKKKLKKVLDAIISLSNGFYIVSKDFDTYKENRICDELIRKELKF